MTLTLPVPADTKRWTLQRKRAILQAITTGALTTECACNLYGFGVEELDSMIQRFKTHGLAALKQRNLQALK